MKFIPNQDYRDKIASIQRLAVNIRARKRPFELMPLTDEAREQIESVTRFEQFKGRILKQNGRRPRVM